MTAITLTAMVVRQETIDVAPLSRLDTFPIAGRAVVEFVSGSGDRMTVDWTSRGDLPSIGSRWTLTLVETP